MTPTTAVILVAALLTLAMGSAEATSLASSEAAAFPPPLDSYQDQDMDGIAAVLGHRIKGLSSQAIRIGSLSHLELLYLCEIHCR